MIRDIVEWVYQRGGWGAVIALASVAGYLWKDRLLRREYYNRRKEARQTAILLHELLKRRGKTRPVSLPDFDDADEGLTTGVINVRDQLEQQASRELDSDIEELLQWYLSNGKQGATPAETPKAKKRSLW